MSVMTVQRRLPNYNIAFDCFMMTGKSYGLKISRVRKAEDEGMYSIQAHNSFGKCEAKCALSIIGKL
mgnify:FL=1